MYMYLDFLSSLPVYPPNIKTHFEIDELCALLLSDIHGSIDDILILFYSNLVLEVDKIHMKLSRVWHKD